MPAPHPAPALAEFQGLYGPFTFSERLLQKIWQRREFNDAALLTVDGRRVVLVDPGRRNSLSGPDFRGARLRLGDGPEATGDVEVHLHAGDWVGHGHSRDNSFNDVILHVVLYPPVTRRATLTSAGREVPMLALLPLLHRALEELAIDDAMETLAGGAEERACGDDLDSGQLRARSAARWASKVSAARLRMQRLGWEDACHHAALEVLGYRFNRVPMLRLAAKFPLSDWSRGAIDGERAYAAEKDRWTFCGVRPANHPRDRLRAYEAWARSRPDWPELLAGWDRRLPEADGDDLPTGVVRRAHRFGRIRQLLAWTVCGDPLGGDRFDTLVCDGFFPMLAARASTEEATGRLFWTWFHWFAGDQPRLLLRELHALGVSGTLSQPHCHGFAQGLLGCMLDGPTGTRERRLAS